MTKKHVHCDVIKAWADGARIQWKSKHASVWYDCDETEPPEWHDNLNYRVKPTLKPDTILFYDVQLINGTMKFYYYSYNDRGTHNLKLVFDGDTGVLKEAEVLK